MDEMIKEWLKQMYEREIEEAQCTLSNEHLWELGYNGNDENPHTQNIVKLQEYIIVLSDRLEELG